MAWSFEAMVKTSNEFIASILKKQEEERVLREESEAETDGRGSV